MRLSGGRSWSGLLATAPRDSLSGRGEWRLQARAINWGNERVMWWRVMRRYPHQWDLDLGLAPSRTEQPEWELIDAFKYASAGVVQAGKPIEAAMEMWSQAWDAAGEALDALGEAWDAFDEVREAHDNAETKKEAEDAWGRLEGAWVVLVAARRRRNEMDDAERNANACVEAAREQVADELGRAQARYCRALLALQDYWRGDRRAS